MNVVGSCQGQIEIASAMW